VHAKQSNFEEVTLPVTSPQKKYTFFSQTEVYFFGFNFYCFAFCFLFIFCCFEQQQIKPTQDSVQMMPTQPRSSSLSKASLTPIHKPQFTKHLQNSTVTEGHMAVMQCIIKDSPNTEITWYKNGDLVQSSAECMINYDRASGLCTLKIPRAAAQDGGQYTCVATNVVGSESSTAWLVVKGSLFSIYSLYSILI
jgi:hypothetical protein